MDYYCSTKFTDMSVSVSSRLVYNCCLAYPERIDTEWLDKNPGRLFHTDTMLKDRKLMLQNKSCESCHWGCYKYEEQGLNSTRRSIKHVKIEDIQSPLKNLQISLSNDCNLMCAYCQPEWSSAWHRDIVKNGEIVLDGSSINTSNWSTLWNKMKQKNRSTDTKFFSLLLREIELATSLEQITLLGGEPLLNNMLSTLIENINDKEVVIVTGLGVSKKRLQSFLSTVKNKRLVFNVSGESTGANFEFLRFGCEWEDYCEKIKIISDSGHQVKFLSTINNISLLDFPNFYDKFSNDYKIDCTMVRERPFMLPHVLDDISKRKIIDWMTSHEDKQKFMLFVDSIKNVPDEKSRVNLANYMGQMSKRRGVDFNFLPNHFRNWYSSPSI